MRETIVAVVDFLNLAIIPTNLFKYCWTLHTYTGIEEVQVTFISFVGWSRKKK